ncbi:MAG: hypothetical protein V5A27_13130, partial [Halapricum sp.]
TNHTDSRWPGATRHDLLGQRGRQRSIGEIEETTVMTTTGGATVPELPSLEDDVYLLEPDVTGPGRRRQAVLTSIHALALDTALTAGGDIVWIDAQGNATTHTLSRVAPSERALDRVHVARAFTTHQHHTLVEGVGRWLRDGSGGPFGSPGTNRPAVLVCPALDALYREGELRDRESRSLLVRALAVISAIARDHGIPVLLTRTRADDYAAPIDQMATPITLEQTTFGPRFESPDLEFETLVYPVDDGVVQTTFAFWREILGARHPGVQAESETKQPASSATVTQGGGW